MPINPQLMMEHKNFNKVEQRLKNYIGGNNKNYRILSNPSLLLLLAVQS